jgi:wobble nucleotide-excising tRNase
MSQGEVNTLPLSVFLPRATSPDSPLRFVVIDDPVQAMDPSKVYGMARVFTDVASTRQVVGFTHNDRLPIALRNLQLPARIIEVSSRTSRW